MFLLCACVRVSVCVFVCVCQRDAAMCMRAQNPHGCALCGVTHTRARAPARAHHIHVRHARYPVLLCVCTEHIDDKNCQNGISPDALKSYAPYTNTYAHNMCSSVLCHVSAAFLRKNKLARTCVHCLRYAVLCCTVSSVRNALTHDKTCKNGLAPETLPVQPKPECRGSMDSCHGLEREQVGEVPWIRVAERHRCEKNTCVNRCREKDSICSTQGICMLVLRWDKHTHSQSHEHSLSQITLSSSNPAKTQPLYRLL